MSQRQQAGRKEGRQEIKNRVEHDPKKGGGGVVGGGSGWLRAVYFKVRAIGPLFLLSPHPPHIVRTCSLTFL